MDGSLFTAARMRAIEAAHFESGAATGAELMERAGTGAVAAMEAAWPDLAARPGRAVLACGPGNNGGDGYVVARLLAQRGWDVTVFALGTPRAGGDAAGMRARWGGPPRPLSELRVQGADLLVDAVFGTGLARAPEGLEALFAASRAGPRVLALDVPSGLDADSGRVFAPGQAVRADLTVSFGAWKAGHALAEGPALCGQVRLVDLGLDLSGAAAKLVGPPHAAALLKGGGHKYDDGHALVLTGGFGHTGAARLAARAALRVGAGLVTLGAPGSAMLECAAQSMAVMLRRVDDGAALAELLRDARFNALCLGPGLGTGDRAAGLVDAALAAGRGCVLDADALTVLAARDAPFGPLHANCVLTPHDGEFARLFPDLAERLRAPAAQGPLWSRIDAAREAASRAGATVLLKGPDTIIAAPDGTVAVHAAAYDRATPQLATAGAGDVLAGLIAGLLARGTAPFDAACRAAWLHVEAARVFGPGLIAEDLPEALPSVLRALAHGT
ncbi:NAD(P)H-hydrate dehydratase [Jannaschia ovalis]|uniref:Bifunctional NAD(P)H-hydrate repair enzyme n=1 Tax=Jannaschia ovalis TaxID=3038773 RepID=A0ABY8LDC9_9RHOB|nr:NAD(P)H-hydrate dehydratase [Jannaschia sp. GRR-S6-38]WGH78080.1 NAD(P)H-hydrate dehydratase [Jannaschia sp. GRR-S6-38]